MRRRCQHVTRLHVAHRAHTHDDDDVSWLGGLDSLAIACSNIKCDTGATMCSAIYATGKHLWRIEMLMLVFVYNVRK